MSQFKYDPRTEKIVELVIDWEEIEGKSPGAFYDEIISPLARGLRDPIMQHGGGWGDDYLVIQGIAQKSDSEIAAHDKGQERKETRRATRRQKRIDELRRLIAEDK